MCSSTTDISSAKSSLCSCSRSECDSFFCFAKRHHSSPCSCHNCGNTKSCLFYVDRPKTIAQNNFNYYCINSYDNLYPKDSSKLSGNTNTKKYNSYNSHMNGMTHNERNSDEGEKINNFDKFTNTLKASRSERILNFVKEMLGYKTFNLDTKIEDSTNKLDNYIKQITKSTCIIKQTDKLKNYIEQITTSKPHDICNDLEKQLDKKKSDHLKNYIEIITHKKTEALNNKEANDYVEICCNINDISDKQKFNKLVDCIKEVTGNGTGNLQNIIIVTTVTAELGHHSNKSEHKLKTSFDNHSAIDEYTENRTQNHYSRPGMHRHDLITDKTQNNIFCNVCGTKYLRNNIQEVSRANSEGQNTTCLICHNIIKYPQKQETCKIKSTEIKKPCKSCNSQIKKEELCKICTQRAIKRTPKIESHEVCRNPQTQNAKRMEHCKMCKNHLAKHAQINESSKACGYEEKLGELCSHNVKTYSQRKVPCGVCSHLIIKDLQLQETRQHFNHASIKYPSKCEEPKKKPCDQCNRPSISSFNDSGYILNLKKKLCEQSNNHTKNNSVHNEYLQGTRENENVGDINLEMTNKQDKNPLPICSEPTVTVVNDSGYILNFTSEPCDHSVKSEITETNAIETKHSMNQQDIKEPTEILKESSEIQILHKRKPNEVQNNLSVKETDICVVFSSMQLAQEKKSCDICIDPKKFKNIVDEICNSLKMMMDKKQENLIDEVKRCNHCNSNQFHETKDNNEKHKETNTIDKLDDYIKQIIGKKLLRDTDMLKKYGRICDLCKMKNIKQMKKNNCKDYNVRKCAHNKSSDKKELCLLCNYFKEIESRESVNLQGCMKNITSQNEDIKRVPVDFLQKEDDQNKTKFNTQVDVSFVTDIKISNPNEMKEQLASFSVQNFNILGRESNQNNANITDNMPNDKYIRDYNNILRKLKEAYIACSCKVCKCLVENSTKTEKCTCNPCDCYDCAKLKEPNSNSAYRQQTCDCKPCNCEKCSNYLNNYCTRVTCEYIECNPTIKQRSTSKSLSKKCTCSQKNLSNINKNDNHDTIAMFASVPNKFPYFKTKSCTSLNYEFNNIICKSESKINNEIKENITHIHTKTISKPTSNENSFQFFTNHMCYNNEIEVFFRPIPTTTLTTINNDVNNKHEKCNKHTSRRQTCFRNHYYAHNKDFKVTPRSKSQPNNTNQHDVHNDIGKDYHMDNEDCDSYLSSYWSSGSISLITKEYLTTANVNKSTDNPFYSSVHNYSNYLNLISNIGNKSYMREVLISKFHNARAKNLKSLEKLTTRKPFTYPKSLQMQTLHKKSRNTNIHFKLYSQEAEEMYSKYDNSTNIRSFQELKDCNVDTNKPNINEATQTVIRQSRKKYIKNHSSQVVIMNDRISNEHYTVQHRKPQYIQYNVNYNKVNENNIVSDDVPKAYRNRIHSAFTYCINDFLNRAEDYVSVQKTLKEAKHFSMELLVRLEMFERANNEFESLSKKLNDPYLSKLKMSNMQDAILQ